MFKRTRGIAAAICGVAAVAVTVVLIASGVTSAATRPATSTSTTASLTLFVRADQNGAVYQHSAGVTVKKDKAFSGVYIVTFKQNISQCAAVVSQGETSNNGFIPGTFYEAVVQSDRFNSGNPHQIYVYATTEAGDSVNAGFDLIVACS